MSIRAIPGSGKYVATAAPHHGHAYGSLVLIDYRPEDDNAMSQVERLTPETPFPESAYGKTDRPVRRPGFHTAGLHATEAPRLPELD